MNSAVLPNTYTCLYICGWPLPYFDGRDCICCHAAQGANPSRQTVAVIGIFICDNCANFNSISKYLLRYLWLAPFLL
jgi:hypothetical protein